MVITSPKRCLCYRSQPHLKAERAKEEAFLARMEHRQRQESRTEVQQPGVAESGHGFWHTMKRINDSKVVYYINKAGDAVADFLNPVTMAKHAWSASHESMTAYSDGHWATGTVLLGESLLDVAGLVPIGSAAAQGARAGGRLVVGAASRVRFFARGGGVSSSQVRQIKSISRFDSSIANARYATKEALESGWLPPYPEKTVLRSLTLGRETKFVRVHASSRAEGGFLLTEKQFNKIGTDPEAIRVYLGLPNKPIYISEVLVPESTTLTLGRIGPQPNFGLDYISGFQYELTSQIPKSSFTNTRLIEDYKASFDFRG